MVISGKVVVWWNECRSLSTDLFLNSIWFICSMALEQDWVIINLLYIATTPWKWNNSNVWHGIFQNHQLILPYIHGWNVALGFVVGTYYPLGLYMAYGCLCWFSVIMFQKMTDFIIISASHGNPRLICQLLSATPPVMISPYQQIRISKMMCWCNAWITDNVKSIHTFKYCLLKMLHRCHPHCNIQSVFVDCHMRTWVIFKYGWPCPRPTTKTLNLATSVKHMWTGIICTPDFLKMWMIVSGLCCVL